MANEKRLIDANALIEQLDEYIQENREQDTCANNFCADVCEVLKNTYVKDAPTVDAVEVVHAEWTHLGGDEWCCTACGEVITTEGSWEKPRRKYCHECGAKMGVENEDEPI